jgi:hypothetical protein
LHATIKLKTKFCSLTFSKCHKRETIIVNNKTLKNNYVKLESTGPIGKTVADSMAEINKFASMQ